MTAQDVRECRVKNEWIGVGKHGWRIQAMYGSYYNHRPKVQHVAALAVDHIVQVLSKVGVPILTSGVEPKVAGGRPLETARCWCCKLNLNLASDCGFTWLEGSTLVSVSRPLVHERSWEPRQQPVARLE